ncbi:hypothetical protein [Pseudomonas cichorii]|uniref:Uncharacterized protein n=1 Tax=Pseudomonas cichorii TaxID=36746 RepID=A0ABQ1DT03_PSECI|nr:hypothetical protein [Pseudomonas cichorii]AHF66015.1 hypothetical protein PCH70_08620 [Pseudomonas cichorii JBC1]QVE17981.1 hypothetical protein KGD89_04270 [Pseudomonas cichorii]GFM94166.1 hypothetical protein PSCICP_41380 [Pseudomonas cichorii]SDP00272.1 hypothetical protein SAMN05216599_116129 [Pseudomonas cichorii]
MNRLAPLLHAVEGEILSDAFVSPEDMARMNEARAAFRELKTILFAQVVPALGGWKNPLAVEIESRIEKITFRSQNFLWPHRNLGAAHSATDVGGTE